MTKRRGILIERLGGKGKGGKGKERMLKGGSKGERGESKGRVMKGRRR